MINILLLNVAKRQRYSALKATGQVFNSGLLFHRPFESMLE